MIKPDAVACPICALEAERQPLGGGIAADVYLCDTEGCPVTSFTIRWAVLRRDDEQLFGTDGRTVG